MSARRIRLALVALALLAWLSTGVTTVAAGESGVVLRYGRAARVVAPGVALKLPWPLERVERVDVGLMRRMPIGYRLKDAERGIDPLPNEVQWLTGDTNIVELRANVLYRVEDPAAWLFHVADNEGEFGHRSFALRRIGEKVLSELVARTPVRDVLAPGAAGLQVRARDGIQAAADALGIGVRVTSVEVLNTAPPLMVIHSFNSVTDARAEADRLLVEARGVRLRELQNAEALANQILSEARSYAVAQEGRAQGLVKQLEAIEAGGLSPAKLRGIWFDIARRILARARILQLPANPDGSPVRYHRVR
ncbi:MAG: protease modulator HflK [Planctomycetota bacterium]